MHSLKILIFFRALEFKRLLASKAHYPERFLVAEIASRLQIAQIAHAIPALRLTSSVFLIKLMAEFSHAQYYCKLFIRNLNKNIVFCHISYFHHL